MTTTPTMAPRSVTGHGRRNFHILAATLAIAVLATVAFLLTSTSSANDPVSETARTSTTSSPATSRGAGDGCALRLETGGGFIEGLGPANRCGDPGGEVVRGGVLE